MRGEGGGWCGLGGCLAGFSFYFECGMDGEVRAGARARARVDRRSMVRGMVRGIVRALWVWVWMCVWFL